MKRLSLNMAIAALMTLSCNHILADFTVKNNAAVNAEIYITAEGYDFISKNSKGNLAFDMEGNLDDPKGKTRTLEPGKSTDYSWEGGDARQGMPLKDLMVKFAGEPDFVRAVKENKVAAGTTQTINLTRRADGKPSINFEGGESLTAKTEPVESVTAGKMPSKGKQPSS
ncbi:MAG: hypothetical protein AB7F19_04835 [Candidatus Babeliales bacterium]